MGKLKKLMSSKVSDLGKSNKSIKDLKEIGEKQQERIFSAKESMVMVIDVSGSMVWGTEGYDTKLDAAKEAALQLMKKSDPLLSRIGLATFSDDSKMVAQIGSSLFHMTSKMEHVGVMGGTWMEKGINIARGELTKAPAKIRRIVLMTDGCTAIPSLSIDEANMCFENKIIIDTVGFGDDCDEELLIEIARITGGVYKKAKDAHELIEKFKQLEVRTRGLLTSGT